MEEIIHKSKEAIRHANETEVERLDVAYQKKLGVMARFNHPMTFSKYLGLYNKYFNHGVMYAS